MKLKKLILSAVMLTVLSAISMVTVADNTGKSYFGVQYSIATYEDEFVEIDPTALIGRFGKYFNNNFSLEGRFGIGLQDDTVDIFGTNVSLELDTLFGVYGVGHINLNESSSVYGMIGFTRAEATISIPGFISESEDESGLSFGIGADIGIGNNVALNIEYTQYLNKSDFDFSAMGLGAVFSF